METNFTPLVEEASKQDLFKHKTHEKVANAVHKLLTSNKGKGQTIGLEGDWGSGKSTVISLLKDKLPDDDFEYFYFDAWAHEGDPLRRVFLESLIDVIGEDNLADLKERISNRKKIVKSKYTRQVTALGKWLSLSLFFVPLGAAIVSTIDISQITLNISYDFNWQFFIGVILSLAPLIVAAINLVKLLRENKKWNDSANWSFLVSEGENETTQEISEDEERSSIEFESYFDEILSVSFEKNKDKQLLMIIDNLDRIDAEVSLRIWSTLQTFLKQRNPDSKEQYHAGNIWIIVPYDLGGLSKLWNVQKGDKEGKKCAQSFFDKCFQLRFEVPRPVFTDWEEFCSQMVRQALGADFKEIDNVINILKLTREDLKDIPTPREIKTYVNQLGVLLLSNEDEKPIDSLAYYVVQRFIKRKSVSKLQDELINGVIPTERHRSNLPASIVKDLAGLSFGVTSKIGQQLLLEPEIERVLSGDSVDDVLHLVETHNEGFWFVFNHHVQSNFGRVFNYTSVIKEALEENYLDKLTPFINSLRKTQVQFDGSKGLDNHLAYLSFVSKLNIPLKSYWNSLGAQIASAFNDPNFEAVPYVEFIEKADELIDDKYKSVKIIASVAVDCWFKWFEASKESDWIKWFVPNPTLLDEIGKNIPVNTPPPKELIPTANALMKIGIDNWNGIIEPIKNHLYWNNGTPSGESHSIDLLKVIYNLSFSENEEVDSLLTDLLHNSAFYNFTYHRRNEDSVFLASILLAKYYTDSIHTFDLTPVGNYASGIQLVKSSWTTRNKENAVRVYDELITTDKELLWQLISDERNKLLVDVLAIAAKRNDEFYNVDSPYKKYLQALKLIGNNEDIDKEVIAKCFVDESSIIEDLKESEEFDVKENSYDLLLLLDLMEDSKVISDALKQLSKGDWDEELKEDTDLSTLNIELYNKHGFKLSKAYYESILEFVTDWFTAILEPTKWQLGHWHEIVNILEDAFLKQLKYNITQLVLNDFEKCSSAFFNKNKEFIDVIRIVQNKSPEIQLFIENLLRGELDKDQLRFIVLLLDEQKPKFDKGFGAVVKDDLLKHFNNSKNSVHEELKALANHLNVEIDIVSEDEK